MRACLGSSHPGHPDVLGESFLFGMHRPRVLLLLDKRAERMLYRVCTSSLRPRIVAASAPACERW